MVLISCIQRDYFCCSDSAVWTFNSLVYQSNGFQRCFYNYAAKSYGWIAIECVYV